MVDARRNSRPVCIAWLDTANAFGSLPFGHMFGTLERIGMPAEMVSVIRDLYAGSTTRGKHSAGLTNSIAIKSGVKQRCPLSPIIFNLSLEPLLRAIETNNASHGYKLGDLFVSSLAYADDIALIANGSDNLQELLDVAGSVTTWSGLRFKPTKCAILSLNPKTKTTEEETVFSIQDANIPILAEGQHYRHLGVLTGFKTKQTPRKVIDTIVLDCKPMEGSLLAPWQKIHAVTTFLAPRLDFILRAADVEMKPLAEADKAIKRYVKSWLYLPQRASAELVHLLPSQSGAGFLSFRDQHNLLAVVNGFRLLTCPDRTVKDPAWHGVREAVRKKTSH